MNQELRVALQKIKANKGGKIAGNARENLEIASGGKVVTPENYLREPEGKKRKRLRV